MRPIRFATGNAHKLREVREILDPIGFEVLGLEGVAGYSVIEDGATFAENAIKKASTLLSLTGVAAFADDSGIAIDALNGEPGIYSARYAGVEGPGADDANLERVLTELRPVAAGSRTARYVCALAYCAPQEDPKVFHGTLEGVLIDERRGSGGFGYDPIFLLPDRGLTVAEITAEEKHAISHRGQAVRKLADFLQGLSE